MTALYEVTLAGEESDVPLRGLDSLRYQAPGSRRAVAGSRELLCDTSRLLEHAVLDGAGDPSVDLRFASAVAGFGMLLRDSEHSGVWTMADVLAEGRRSQGEDLHGYRAEFVRLVETVVQGEMLARATP